MATNKTPAPAAPEPATDAADAPGMVGEFLETTEWFGRERHLADPATRHVSFATGREEFVAQCGREVLDQATHSNAARDNGRKKVVVAQLPECPKCFEVKAASEKPAPSPEAILEGDASK